MPWRGGNDAERKRMEKFSAAACCFLPSTPLFFGSTQCRNVTIMLCKKLCDDFDAASNWAPFANHIVNDGDDLSKAMTRTLATDVGKRALNAARHKKLPSLRTNGSSLPCR